MSFQLEKISIKKLPIRKNLPFQKITYPHIISYIAAPTDFTVTLARSEVITFLTPIVQYYHVLFIKNPTETYNYMAYIEPLHWLAWLVIIIFVLFACPVLWFAAR